MVVADICVLQALAQALLDGLALLSSCYTAQPSQFPASRSARRRGRRHATLRKLYSTPVVDEVLSEVTPSPIPTGSTLPTNHGEALTDDEVATVLSDPPSVHLCTHDCRRSAPCLRIKSRLETDFMLLRAQ